MAIFQLFGIFINMWANSWSSTSVFGHFRLNLLNLSVFTIFFRFIGLGQFLSVLTQIYINLRNHKLTTTAWSLKSTRVRGCVFIISLYAMGLSTVPACVPACQKCASVPEGHPWSDWASLDVPEVPRCPRCPEGQDVVPLCQMAQNPQDCTYGIIFTWNDDICIV